jgi:pheromone shutdown protein TraB
VLAALAPELGTPEDWIVANPIGIAAVGNPEESALGVALLNLIGLLAVMAFGSLVLRFRRSRGEERQQLKWFTYAGALLPLAVLLLTVPADLLLANFLPAAVGELVVAVPIVCLPAAAGIAILRYRLYDIDRLINRTLVYGLLTALLASVYACVVVVLPGTWVLG